MACVRRKEALQRVDARVLGLALGLVGLVVPAEPPLPQPLVAPPVAPGPPLPPGPVSCNMTACSCGDVSLRGPASLGVVTARGNGSASGQFWISLCNDLPQNNQNCYGGKGAAVVMMDYVLKLCVHWSATSVTALKTARGVDLTYKVQGPGPLTWMFALSLTNGTDSNIRSVHIGHGTNKTGAIANVYVGKLEVANNSTEVSGNEAGLNVTLKGNTTTLFNKVVKLNSTEGNKKHKLTIKSMLKKY